MDYSGASHLFDDAAYGNIYTQIDAKEYASIREQNLREESILRRISYGIDKAVQQAEKTHRQQMCAVQRGLVDIHARTGRPAAWSSLSLPPSSGSAAGHLNNQHDAGTVSRSAGQLDRHGDGGSARRRSCSNGSSIRRPEEQLVSLSSSSAAAVGGPEEPKMSLSKMSARQRLEAVQRKTYELRPKQELEVKVTIKKTPSPRLPPVGAAGGTSPGVGGGVGGGGGRSSRDVFITYAISQKEQQHQQHQQQPNTSNWKNKRTTFPQIDGYLAGKKIGPAPPPPPVLPSPQPSEFPTVTQARQYSEALDGKEIISAIAGPERTPRRKHSLNTSLPDISEEVDVSMDKDRILLKNSTRHYIQRATYVSAALDRIYKNRHKSDKKKTSSDGKFKVICKDSV